MFMDQVNKEVLTTMISESKTTSIGLDFLVRILNVCNRFTLRRNTSTFATAIVLSAMLLTSDALSYRRLFYHQVTSCKGQMQRKCDKLSSYCNPRILKRSIDATYSLNYDVISASHNIVKRSRRRRFRVNCRLCSWYCWR